MPVFKDAWRAMGRNYLWVGVYVGSVAGFGALFHMFGQWHDALVGHGPVPPHLASIGLVADLLYAAVSSAMAAVVFAEMGKEIDRPLWKCSGAREALGRYFLPWFLLSLMMMALVRLMVRADEADLDSLAILLEFGRIGLLMVFIPTGACIMYHRGLEWSRLPEILAPLARLFGAALGAFLLGLFQWALQPALYVALPEALRSSTTLLVLIDVPLSLLDCYIFCAVWHICILDRDMQLSGGSDDFDF